jgi:TonB family protein
MIVQKTKIALLVLIMLLPSYGSGISMKPIKEKVTTELIDMDAEANFLPEAEVMAPINARIPGFRNIYKKYLKEKPGFSGKVMLKFIIAPDGKIVDISNISIVSSTTDYPEFDNAIKKFVATHRWKANNDNGSTTLTIPFDFIKEE